MKQSTRDFLNLFFNQGETICVSHDKFGYHSVAQEDIDKEITLISPNKEVAPKVITEDDINLVTINPVNGFRQDKNVTAYRSFLVELDEGPLALQKKYVEEMEMPYSICIFSGNKSLHFGIVLDEELFHPFVWKTIAQWILNIMTKADQKTKNPSRNIRFPNNIRKDGLQKRQSLVEFRGRVSQAELNIWLNKFPQCRPRVENKPLIPQYGDHFKPIFGLPKLAKSIIDSGITSMRNDTWFIIACNCANSGMSFERSIDELRPYFNEEVDFPEKEWLGIIKSAFNHVQGQQNG